MRRVDCHLRALALAWAPIRNERGIVRRGVRRAASESGSTGTSSGAASSKPGAEALKVEVVQVKGPGTSTKTKVAVGLAGVAGLGGLAYVYNERQAAAEALKRQQEAEAKALAKREAAARKAKAEADAEAARVEAARKAAAAKAQRLLAAVEAALDQAAGWDYDWDLAHVVAIAEAAPEVPADSEALLKAHALFDRCSRKKQALLDHSSALQTLQDTLQARDILGCRAAIEKATAAEAALVELQEAVPPDGGFVVYCRGELQVMERLEMEAARRDAAFKELTAAVESRDRGRCAAAVSEAKDAQVEHCTLLEIASVLANPKTLAEALVTDSTAHLMELHANQGSPGIAKQDFEAAASAAAADMSTEDLRSRAVELAKAIATQRHLRVLELQEELKKAEAELLRRCIARNEAAVAHFVQEKDNIDQHQEAALKTAAATSVEEEIAAIRAQVAQEVESATEQMFALVQKQALEMIAAARENFLQRFAAVQVSIAAVAELETSAGPKQRSQASHNLSGAVLALEEALVSPNRSIQAELDALQAASGSDGFVERLLACLPGDAVAWSARSVPTEPQLKSFFNKQLSTFVIGAFALPADGPYSSFFSDMVANVCGRLYRLRSHEDPADDATASSVNQNLKALATAVKLIENGEVQSALHLLELKLTGECRKCASEWMATTRNALMMQQAARAVQAKARCLDAVIE